MTTGRHPTITEQVIATPELQVTALCAGPTDGDVVVLLHGFPDHPATFEAQLAALADAGFRAIAPTMRGYEPSSQPADGDHSLPRLASDVVDILDASGIDRAHVVGHDWGAAVVYVLAATHADRLRTATAMALPPTPRIPAALRHVPRQLQRSWYMTFFQIPWLPARVLKAFRWRFVRRLRRTWSPGFDLGDDRWAELVATLERPGVRRSMLAYYRQNATPPILLGLRKTTAMRATETAVPLLILFGEDDGCMDARLYPHTVVERDHPAGVRSEGVASAGHFLHLEAPAEVNRLLLEHLDR